jgi:hypothetical protein
MYQESKMKSRVNQKLNRIQQTLHQHFSALETMSRPVLEHPWLLCPPSSDLLGIQMRLVIADALKPGLGKEILEETI